MKACLSCGTQAPDDALACAQCGRPFAYRGPDAAPVVAPRDGGRPDGRAMKTTGGVVGVVGAVMWLLSATLDLNPDGVSVETATRIGLAAIGGLGVQVGLMMWLVGHVIFAMSFLKGRDE